MKFYLKDYLKEINPDKNILISLNVEITKNKSKIVLTDVKATDKELLKYSNYQVLCRRAEVNNGVSLIYTVREPSKVILPEKAVTEINEELALKIAYKDKDGIYKPKNGFETSTSRLIKLNPKKPKAIIEHVKTKKYFNSLSTVQIKKLNDIAKSFDVEKC